MGISATGTMKARTRPRMTSLDGSLIPIAAPSPEPEEGRAEQCFALLYPGRLARGSGNGLETLR